MQTIWIEFMDCLTEYDEKGQHYCLLVGVTELVGIKTISTVVNIVAFQHYLTNSFLTSSKQHWSPTFPIRLNGEHICGNMTLYLPVLVT